MNQYKELIEDILLLRCQLGDREALAELFKKRKRSLNFGSLK
jgi:hypothetical protein